MAWPAQPVSRGITLVELLIAVAILAILAAIAGPNLLEGQTRSKVAHARSDMLMLIRAAEAYKVDLGGYMVNSQYKQPDMTSWTSLTTPIAYISAVPQSPFMEVKNKYGNPPYTGSDGNNGNYFEYWSGAFVNGSYRLDSGSTETGIFWRASSNGPDNLFNIPNGTFTNYSIRNRHPLFINSIYDPSNGTLSRGDMYFCNKGLIN